MSPRDDHQVPTEPVPDNDDPLPDEDPTPEEDPVPDHNPVVDTAALTSEAQTSRQTRARIASRSARLFPLLF
jgi:hypothetical protein